MGMAGERVAVTGKGRAGLEPTRLYSRCTANRPMGRSMGRASVTHPHGATRSAELWNTCLLEESLSNLQKKLVRPCFSPQNGIHSPNSSAV